jgi:hypothetical protein
MQNGVAKFLHLEYVGAELLQNIRNGGIWDSERAISGIVKYQ